MHRFTVTLAVLKHWEKGSFPLHHLEGTRRVVVLGGWLVCSPPLPPVCHALFKTCTRDSLPPACPGVTEFGTGTLGTELVSKL